MNYRGGVLTGVAATLLLVGAVAAGWWLLHGSPADSAKTSPPPIPATVPKPFKEDQATAITLTADAEARLAIRLGAIERKPVKRLRTFGGEVTIPPGRAVVVSAPLAGMLKAIAGVEWVAGLSVKKGQPIVQLLPLLDPVGRANLSAAKIDSQGKVENAQEQLKAATTALDRETKVFKDGAGSRKMVDDAQAAVDIARAALETAIKNRDWMTTVVGQVESGTTTAMPLEAPEEGVLRGVSALPGQNVPAGAAIFEVVNLDRVWVRVPVYVGDLPELDATATGRVGNLTAAPGEATFPATPVSAPPTANPATGTADLFYALDNREPKYRPGQRVAMALPLTGPAESLTVPWSAIVYDIHGGAWVYEKTGEHQYTRRRVVVRYVTGDVAVLASGPATGTQVVTAGAAELFGTETGFSK